MMDFLVRLEATGLSTWLRESPSMLAFPFVLVLHTLGLGLIVGSSLVVNLRILGAASRIPLKPLEAFFPIMWFGFSINAISGLMLLAKSATTVGVSGIFWVKIALIALAITALARIKHTLFADPLLDTRPVPASARALAVASILLWTGAITAGRLMAYIGPTQPEASILFGSR